MFGWVRTLKTPSVLLPVFAVLSLTLVAVTYYFFWVRTQTQEFDDRAFRKIANISDTLSQELKLYRAVLSYSWRGPSTYMTPKETFADLLHSEVPDLQDCPTKPVSRTAESALVQSIQESGNFPLSGSAGGTKCISLTTLASGAIGSTFPADLFDEILIATRDGSVLFQSTRTGLRITDLKEMYPKDHDLILPLGKSDGSQAKIEPGVPEAGSADSFEDARGHSELEDVQIAGTGYRIYLVPIVTSVEGVQPLQIPTHTTHASAGEEKVGLLVVGLIKTRRFQTSTFAAPKNMTIWGLLILSYLLIGFWPPLRLLFTRYTDRIPASTVACIFLMNVVAGAVLGVMVPHTKMIMP